MRATIILALAALAACSDGGGTEANVTEPVADSLDAGLWEVTSDVTDVTATDHAPATAIKTKAGDKITAQFCVGEADRAKPEPALFAGADYDCQYRDSYIRGGRLNASLNCTYGGVKGEVMMALDGRFKADSFEGEVSTTSYFAGDGDFRMKRRISGRHVGACPAEGLGNEAAANVTKGE